MLDTLRTRALSVGALALAAALLVVPAPVVAAGTAAPSTCADVAVQPGQVHCFIRVSAPRSARAAGVRAFATAGPPGGWGPRDIAAMYDLPAIPATVPVGTGPTVAVIEADHTSTIASDLAAFRSAYGLGTCGTADGCLTIVGQDGSRRVPSRRATLDQWDWETIMDVEAVAASCPACRILVVEADSTYSTDTDVATETAARLADYVSMSWGSSDDGFTPDGLPNTEKVFGDHPDVTFVASTGDLGWTTNDPTDGVTCGLAAAAGAGDTHSCTNYPASSPRVVAAGGTVASYDGAAWTQQAWGDSDDPTQSFAPNAGGSSSGCSGWATMPTFQAVNANARAACGNTRATADISALADGFAMYHSGYSGGPWYPAGGTSLSAPLIAGMYAQAGNHTRPFDIYARAKADAAAFIDVTAGTPARGCPATDALHLCSAGPGWDGPTGLGTPRGLASLMPYAAQRTSSPVTATLSPVSHRGLVRIRGKARVRRTLRASYGTFTPGSRVTVTWLVDGHPVAAGARLRVRRGWRHHRIRYIVNATAAGHAPVTFTSSAVRIRG